MGLSATLDDDQKKFLKRFGLNVCVTLNEAEAEREGFIATSVTYNLPVEITLEDREFIKLHDNIIDNTLSKFEGNIDVIRGCTIAQNAWYKGKTGARWVAYWEKYNQFNLDAAAIKRFAHQFNNSVKERKNFLYNCNDKVETVEKIIRKFNVPTIIFSESVEFANKIVDRNPDIAKAYHSKIRSEVVYRGKTIAIHVSKNDFYLYSTSKILPFKEIKRMYGTEAVKLSSKKAKERTIIEFNNHKFHALSTVSSLDEGFDSDIIELVIIASGTSTVRKEIQRRGRGLRKRGDKITTIINLYIAETQDELWLNRKQNSISKSKIRKISNFEEIKLGSDGKLKYDLTK